MMFVLPVSVTFLVYAAIGAGIVIMVNTNRPLEALGVACVLAVAIYFHVQIRRQRKARERKEGIAMMQEAIERAERVKNG